MRDEPSLIEKHQFRQCDLIGGHPVLDFVNTVTGWNGRPRDWIADYAALVEWARFSGILAQVDADFLRELAGASPGAAATALKKVKQLRAAIHGLLTARVDATPPRPEDLSTVERMWRSFNSHRELVIDLASGIRIRAGRARLDLISMELIEAFVRLGEDIASPRLKRCAGVNCGWFFFDMSKPGRRRWCDMATCGNAAKYVRYREQHSA